MRRRSLFAGLAGLLAAQKGAAAVAAAPAVDAHAIQWPLHDLVADLRKPIAYGRVRCVAAHELSSRAQFLVHADDGPEAILPLSRGADGALGIPAPAAGGPGSGSVAQCAAPPGPIGIAWSGYADPDPRSLVSPPHGLERAEAGGRCE
jgi:hypothetical protein